MPWSRIDESNDARRALPCRVAVKRIEWPAMGSAMIHGYHVIFGAYGFWLPNDPRGSWSDFVAAWELLKFGKATKVSTRESVAHVRHDRQIRLEAKKSLKYPPVLFSGEQAVAIGAGFARAVLEGGYGILACCLLACHVRVVAAPRGWSA